MYEQFFGLAEMPFSLSPDPRFLWLSETHQEGLATLEYGLKARKGFVLLTGEVGSGKTTLLRSALERLGDDLPDTAMVMNTVGLGAVDLLKLVAVEFRLQTAQEATATQRSAADYILLLNSFLLDLMHKRRSAALIVDEAQNLSLEALEQVRLLSNLETHSEKLLQIVLTGQPELRDRLADPRLRQLRQRIAVEHHVVPLTRDEVGHYLRHRIAIAGGRFENLFFANAEDLFAEFSCGCPRLVNVLADRALLAAYSRGLRPVPPRLLELKALELGRGVPGAPRPSVRRA
jgi:general secretion pathway protein A